MNGLVSTSMPCATWPELKVLFITGYAENAVLTHSHVAHGMEVLTKPFTVDALITRVDRMLRER